ncbi:MAG: adenine phosphoribosyltransferase [Chloroflexi bacterium]|nr:adenine phosphoribosyltransferase [Chloroflexota bacterium]
MQSVDLKAHIRDIPDFPTPGILFRDITPLLKDSAAFRAAIDQLAEYCASVRPDAIVAIEARGFLLAAPLAYKLGKPLIPVRKKGKLPFRTYKVEYALEYGSDAVEVHVDGIARGQRVVIVDDLLATGGTMAAAARLVEETGGRVAGLAVLIELADLKGRKRLKGYDIISLVTY